MSGRGGVGAGGRACHDARSHDTVLERFTPPSSLRIHAGGVGLFAIRSSRKVVSKLASPNAPLGYALCLTNLVLDG